ncbi:helix-turn-helix domain-containing protein [Paenibacillus yanchengensis]|uniref:Helix-turn-helix domain-containing protein n=1 Tax=Paenibacillus yanchengensis TaxID=2035833 RepID=A0ABW4YMH7_9BACL
MTARMQVRSFIGAHEQEWEDPCFFQHQSVEITVILEGEGLLRWTNGQAEVDWLTGEKIALSVDKKAESVDEIQTKQARVEAGQVIIIPTNVSHSFHARTRIRFGVLLIDELHSLGNDLIDKIYTSVAANRLTTPAIISLSPLDKEQYELLFRQWLRMNYSTMKETQLQYETWVQLLLLFLYERCYLSAQAVSISFIADYIKQHLQTNIQVTTLAKLAGLSEEGLRKRFVKTYGMTPKNYQQMCRLSEAKWLLSSSDKDMQTIAEMIGFARLHSFSAWFKEMEAMSPTEWRKQQSLNH